MNCASLEGWRSNDAFERVRAHLRGAKSAPGFSLHPAFLFSQYIRVAAFKLAEDAAAGTRPDTIADRDATLWHY